MNFSRFKILKFSGLSKVKFIADLFNHATAVRASQMPVSVSFLRFNRSPQADPYSLRSFGVIRIRISDPDHADCGTVGTSKTPMNSL